MLIDELLQTALTQEQRGAATDRAAEILTLACAGSGKTRTTAYRIARLVADGEDPAGIVAFTFTEKAADSMKLQVAKALEAAGFDPTVLGSMYIGTIHSYCQTILGQMNARYRQFDVLDENRLKLFLISRFYQLGLNVVQQVRAARYFVTIKEIAEAWKIVNDEMIGIDQVAVEDPQLGQVMQALSGRLDADEFIDFSLMIRLVVEALQRNDLAAERAISQLKHLIVDEYQDTNPSQELLIRELYRRAKTLFVVGDDDQAIYAWRGADVSNILEFQQRWTQCSTHTLPENFRSTRAIVTMADQFVAAELGAQRIVKNPEATDPVGPRDVRNLWFPIRSDEAEWVVTRIQSLLGTEYVERDGTLRGLTPADFAILMRSTRADEGDTGTRRHDAFTSILTARGIAYSLDSGAGIFDRPQVLVIRDALELLRSGSPDRNVAATFFNQNVVPAFPRASFNSFVAVLADWGRRIHAPAGGARQRLLPQQLLYELLNAFGLEETNFDAGTMQDLGVFSRILQDVEAVYLSVDSPGRFREILNFLGNVAESGYDSASDDVLRRPDAVTVSTVHRVKGLEFPVVFIVDVENGRFPGDRRNYLGWLPGNIIGPALSRNAYQSMPPEEIRLFYTAMTRAERFLYISGSQSLPGGKRMRAQSRFALRLQHPELSADATALPNGLQPRTPARRIDETIMPTSYSEIKTYLRCPKDYQYRQTFGFSPSIPEMFGFGKTVHTAIGKLHELFAEAVPTGQGADDIARDVFHLKHVAPSRDPQNRPGPYERAKDRAAEIVRQYAENFQQDFSLKREVEAQFEILIANAVISGSIDLLLQVDENNNIVDATVVDFKAMQGGQEPESNQQLEWTDLSLQVQLYAKAAKEVLGENARTGAVHLLKDNQRVQVPVTDEAIQAAVANVEWAVERILAGQFPMRPQAEKCAACDFRLICPKRPEEFASSDRPPAIEIPGGTKQVLAFSAFDSVSAGTRNP
jgi:DNA helicase-2/ATP-dependent DNA helicase PcrA